MLYNRYISRCYSIITMCILVEHLILKEIIKSLLVHLHDNIYSCRGIHAESLFAYYDKVW